MPRLSGAARQADRKASHWAGSRLGRHNRARAKAAGVEMLDMIFFTEDQVATMKTGELNDSQDKRVAIWTAMKAAAGA